MDLEVTRREKFQLPTFVTHFRPRQVKGEARDNLISCLLGTWLKGGVGIDLFKGVGVLLVFYFQSWLKLVG